MTEQNKNEVSELERKWQEDLLLALSKYKDNYQESFNNLPLSLQDEAHGINYERGLDSDEIIAFMVAYLAACKARQSEIDEIKERELSFCYDLQLFVHDLLMEKGEYWTFQCIRKKTYTHSKDKKWGDDSYIEDKFKGLDSLLDKLKSLEQENERLKKRNNKLEDFCQEFVYGEENPEYYKTMGEKLKEREEMIREAIPWMKWMSEGGLEEYAKLRREWLEKAKKLVGEKCLKQDT